MNDPPQPSLKLTPTNTGVKMETKPASRLFRRAFWTLPAVSARRPPDKRPVPTVTGHDQLWQSCKRPQPAPPLPTQPGTNHESSLTIPIEIPDEVSLPRTCLEERAS